MVGPSQSASYFRCDTKELLNIFQLLFELEKFLHLGYLSCCFIISKTFRQLPFLFFLLSLPPYHLMSLKNVLVCSFKWDFQSRQEMCVNAHLGIRARALLKEKYLLIC